MKNTILLLRISYGWGIIADALMAFLMLHPDLFVRFTNVKLEVNDGLRFGLRYGAPLMIGWTLLLLWADRKPMERKDILPLTLVVVAGYVITEVYSVVSGETRLSQVLPVFAMQVLMSAMFVYSYIRARSMSPVGKEHKT